MTLLYCTCVTRMTDVCAIMQALVVVAFAQHLIYARRHFPSPARRPVRRRQRWQASSMQSAPIIKLNVNKHEGLKPQNRRLSWPKQALEQCKVPRSWAPFSQMI